jgi:hypothetical protein
MARSRLDSSSVDFAFMGDPVEPTSGPPMWSFISFPAILFCATVAGEILAIRLRPPVRALVIVAMNTILLHVGGQYLESFHRIRKVLEEEPPRSPTFRGFTVPEARFTRIQPIPAIWRVERTGQPLKQARALLPTLDVVVI